MTKWPKPKLSDRENELRWEAYQECSTEKEMAERVGICPSAFNYWLKQRKLSSKTERMRKFIAGRPEWERQRMKHFCVIIERIIHNTERGLKIKAGAGAELLEAYRKEYGCSSQVNYGYEEKGSG